MTRGIRNNNPGNIERGANWQGLAEPHEMTPDQKTETRFAVFRSPEWGIRAIARILATYRTKHRLTTVLGIISRWAPASENDVESYAAAVSRAIGVTPSNTIDTANPAVLAPLIAAIIQHENGTQPYSMETIRAGIALAGVKAPRARSIVTSKRLRGGAVVTGTTAALTTSEQLFAFAKRIVAMFNPDLAASGDAWTFVAIFGTALAGFGLYVGWTILADYQDRTESEMAER